MVSSGFNIMRLSAFQYTIAQGVILIGVMVVEVVQFNRRTRAVPPRPSVPAAAAPAAID
jgi:simple sugar transport system permease protein